MVVGIERNNNDSEIEEHAHDLNTSGNGAQDTIYEQGGAFDPYRTIGQGGSDVLTLDANLEAEDGNLAVASLGSQLPTETNQGFGQSGSRDVSVSKFVPISQGSSIELQQLRQQAIDGLCTDTGFLRQLAALKTQMAAMQRSITDIPVLEKSLETATQEIHAERRRAASLEAEVDSLKVENGILRRRLTEQTAHDSEERTLLATEVETQRRMANVARTSLNALTTKMEEQARENVQLVSKKKELEHANAYLEAKYEALQEAHTELQATHATLLAAVDLEHENEHCSDAIAKINDTSNSKSKKEGSYSQLLMENMAMAAQLSAEQAESSRLQACLEAVASSLEERVPLLAEGERARQRLDALAVEFEEILSSNQTLTAQLEAVTVERQQLEREGRQLRACVADLERQVRILLSQIEGIPAEQEHECGPRKITFRNITELQERNSELLKAVHELSTSLEQAKANGNIIVQKTATDEAPFATNGDVFGGSHIGTSMETQSSIGSVTNITPSTLPADILEKNPQTPANALQSTLSPELEKLVTTLQEEISSLHIKLSRREENLIALEAAISRRDEDAVSLRNALHDALTHAESMRFELGYAQRTTLDAKAAAAASQAEAAATAAELRLAQSSIALMATGHAEERASLHSALLLLERRLADMEQTHANERQDAISRLQMLEGSEVALRTSLADAERLVRATTRTSTEHEALTREERLAAQREIEMLRGRLTIAETELADGQRRLEAAENRLDLVLGRPLQKNTFVDVSLSSSRQVSESSHDSASLLPPITSSLPSSGTSSQNHGANVSMSSSDPELILSNDKALTGAPQLARKYLRMAEEAMTLRETQEATVANLRASEDLVVKLRDELAMVRQEMLAQNERIAAQEALVQRYESDLEAYRRSERLAMEQCATMERLRIELEESRHAYGALVAEHAALLTRDRERAIALSEAERTLADARTEAMELRATVDAVIGERDAAEAASRALVIAIKNDDQNRSGDGFAAEISALEIAALEVEAQRLRMAVTRLEAALAEARQRKDNAEDAVELKIQLRALLDSNMLLRDQLQHTETKLHDKDIELKEKNAELTTISLELKEKSMKLQDADSRMSGLREKVSTLRERVSELDVREASLMERESLKETQDAEIKALRERITVLEDALRLKSQRIESILEKYRVLKQGFLDEKAVLEQRITQLTTELSETIKEHNTRFLSAESQTAASSSYDDAESMPSIIVEKQNSPSMIELVSQSDVSPLPQSPIDEEPTQNLEHPTADPLQFEGEIEQTMDHIESHDSSHFPEHPSSTHSLDPDGQIYSPAPIKPSDPIGEVQFSETEPSEAVITTSQLSQNSQSAPVTTDLDHSATPFDDTAMASSSEAQLLLRQEEIKQRLLKRLSDRQQAENGGAGSDKRPFQRITPPEFTTETATSGEGSLTFSSILNPYLKRSKSGAPSHATSISKRGKKKK